MTDPIHECNQLPQGIRVERDNGYLGSSDGWVLVVSREATEEDLEENHYLEAVGENIWTTAVQIAYCPFCGGRLGPLNEVEDAFVHFDFCQWEASASLLHQ